MGRAAEIEDVDRDQEETDSGGGPGCSTIITVIAKFMLFITNFIVWVSSYRYNYYYTMS